MALVTYTPEVLQNNTTVPDTIQPSNYDTVLSEVTPSSHSSILQYIDGGKWVTKAYYHQLLGQGDFTRVHDSNLPDVLQQYTKINNFILRTDAPLSSSYDNNTNTFTVTGSSNVIGPISPNRGDMFVAQVLGNREGIFTVTDAVDNTYSKSPVVTIEYVLLAYIDESIGINKISDLETKVVRQYSQVSDPNSGVSSLLSDSTLSNISSLSETLPSIINNYFTNFYSNRYSTFITPGQSNPLYDSYLTKYFMEILSTGDHVLVHRVRILNDDQDVVLNQPTIFDAILQSDIRLLSRVNNIMGYASTSLGSSNNLTSNMAVLGIYRHIYPITTNIPNLTVPKIILANWGNTEVTNNNVDLINPIKNSILFGGNSINIIPDLISEPGYIFSLDFYNDNPNVSLFETLLLNYIKNIDNDLSSVVSVVEDSWTWGVLEQYYFTPILITIIKDTINKSYQDNKWRIN